MHIAGADRPTAVHSNRMDEVPDKYLVEVLPLAKKLAKAMGLINYNVLQACAFLDPSLSSTP